MKRNLILGLLVVGGLCFISSCKDDEVPIAGISFELAEQEVTESDGTPESFHPDIADEGEGRVLPVKLVFDRALAGDVVLKFDVDGTALGEATNDELNDYEILEESDFVTIDDDEITILKGAEEASFDIVVFEDLLFFEYDNGDVNDAGVPFKTIELTLESIISGPGKLGSQLEHTLKILEDDAVVVLQWTARDEGMTPEQAAVDMDILFWLNGSLIDWFWAANPGSEFEGIWVPAGFGEGDFGLSYTYYSGNSNDLEFLSAWFTTAGTLDGEGYVYTNDPETAVPLIFEGGHYTQANLNPWDQEGAITPKISQTMVKSGINYSNMSALAQFESGSRSVLKPQMKLDGKLLQNMASKGKNGGYRRIK